MRKKQMKQYKGEKKPSVKNHEVYHIHEAPFIARAYRIFPNAITELANKYGQYDPLTVNVAFLSGRYAAEIDEAKEVYEKVLMPIIKGKQKLSDISSEDLVVADLILTILAQEDNAKDVMGMHNTELTLETLITRLNLPKLKQ